MLAGDRESAAPFRVAFVPGVTLDRWSRIWDERMREIPLQLLPIDEAEQTAVLRAGRAEMSFVRPPIERRAVELIPLYSEVPVVVVPTGHPITAYDEITAADLAGEQLIRVPPATYAEAILDVAGGRGVVVVPMSVARLHHRKDLTSRPVTDIPETQIGLAWLAGTADPRIEQFIGIVRGRTSRSSRGGETPRGRRSRR